LIEVKTSRSDFIKDLKGKFLLHPCTYNLIAYPYGLIRPDELPEGWYGLEMAKTCDCVHRVRAEHGKIYNMTAETSILYQTRIFLRSIYMEKYSESRQRQKEERVRNVERQVESQRWNVKALRDRGMADEEIVQYLKSRGFRLKKGVL